LLGEIGGGAEGSGTISTRTESTTATAAGISLLKIVYKIY
jgi:hypothetical protein